MFKIVNKDTFYQIMSWGGYTPHVSPCSHENVVEEYMNGSVIVGMVIDTASRMYLVDSATYLIYQTNRREK